MEPTFNFAQIMPRLGYELWDLDWLGLIEHPREFGARDSELVDAVLARLPSLPSPFLLHVVTMTSHAPFTQHRAWWSGPRTGNDYYDALACVDAQLDRLLTGFFQRAPSGLVVLFGDHAAGVASSTIERVRGVQREYVPLPTSGPMSRPVSISDALRSLTSDGRYCQRSVGPGDGAHGVRTSFLQTAPSHLPNIAARFGRAMRRRSSATMRTNDLHC